MITSFIFSFQSLAWVCEFYHTFFTDLAILVWGPRLGSGAGGGGFGECCCQKGRVQLGYGKHNRGFKVYLALALNLMPTTTLIFTLLRPRIQEEDRPHSEVCPLVRSVSVMGIAPLGEDCPHGDEFPWGEKPNQTISSGHHVISVNFRFKAVNCRYNYIVKYHRFSDDNRWADDNIITEKILVI